MISTHKIILVLKREYLTRVRTKAFILSTLLTPLALFAFIAIMVWISIGETTPQKTIGIVDQTTELYPRLVELNESRYTDLSSIDTDSLRSAVLSGNLDGYIFLDNTHIDGENSPQLVYGGTGGISLIAAVRDDLREVIREERLERAGVSDNVREIFESRPGLESIKLTEEGEKDDNTIFASALGFILGLIIFIGLFSYGAILMRGVIEEKTNRIVEVIASSVKPIELMTGKLLGICLLAVTQFMIWIVAYFGLSIAAAPFAAAIVDAQMQNMPEEAAEAAQSFDPAILDSLVFEPSLFVYFIIFFIVGFLIYSAMFAAIGAAVDSEQDTQQFMVPLMLPIMLGYFLNTRIMVDPDSTLSVVASLFPLTAPINMITRIAVTEVPFWEIALSIGLMILTFVGIMWLGAKIYRVGILMYGKKVSFGEIFKWIRQR